MARQAEHASTALGRDRRQHQVLIETLYLAILGRKPDLAGMIDYLGMVMRKPEQETLIAMMRSLANSEEAMKFRQHLKDVHG